MPSTSLAFHNILLLSLIIIDQVNMMCNLIVTLAHKCGYKVDDFILVKEFFELEMSIKCNTFLKCMRHIRRGVYP